MNKGIKIISLPCEVYLYCFEEKRKHQINKDVKLISLSSYKFSINEVKQIIFKETWSFGKCDDDPRKLYYNDLDYFYIGAQLDVDDNKQRKLHNKFLEKINTEISVNKIISGYRMFCPELLKTFFIYHFDLKMLMEKYG